MIDWTQSPRDKNLRRGVNLVEGFDCIDHPEECTHKDTSGNKAAHGRQRDIVAFIITDGTHALAFERTIQSIRGRTYDVSYPPSVDSFFHSANPLTEDEIRGELGPGNPTCEYLDAKPCYSKANFALAEALAARFLWTPKGHLHVAGDEPEFWRALEDRFAQVVREGASNLARCPTCNGRGLVER